MQKIIGAGVLEFNPQQATGRFTANDGKSVAFKVLKESPTADAGFPELVVEAHGKPFLITGNRIIRVTGPIAGWQSPKLFPNWASGNGNARSILTAIPHGVPSVGWRNSWLNRGSSVYIPFQYTPGPQGSVFREVEQPASPVTNGQIWTFSGQAVVPQSATAPVTLINTAVPLHSRLRLSTYTTKLGPSELWDQNYIWRLQIGGFDIWNPFTVTPTPGRPSRSDAPVQISPQLEDLPVFEPGTPIVVLVQAVNAIAADDVVAVSLGGTLWGDT